MLFKYFNEVINGTPNPTSVAKCTDEMPENYYYCVQLKKQYRNENSVYKNSKYLPTRLRVHKDVLLQRPEFVKIAVSVAVPKSGKQPFHCIRLNMPEMDKANEYELHTLKFEQSFKNPETTVVMAGGCEHSGKPACTLANLNLNS